MDSTANFSYISFSMSPRKTVQILYKTSRSRDNFSANFSHFEHISEYIWKVFSFSGSFLTVNTFMFVYRDNEPVLGRI